jgi:hypothetical protein
MLGFPKPYEDETLGSLLIRAHRHVGLPFPLLKEQLGIPRGASVGLTQGRWIPAFSLATGLDRMWLVRKHTLLPYVTSTCSASESERAFNEAKKGDESESNNSRIANAVRFGGKTRFCEECIIEDIATKGESFWRRRDQLPGVYVCTKHGSPLLTVPADMFRRSVVDLMPTDCLGLAQKSPLWKNQLSVARLSVCALNGEKLTYTRVRDAAIDAGMGGEASSFAARLHSALKVHFDDAYLRGSSVPSKAPEHWILPNLRGTSNQRTTPLRRILLLALLALIDVETDESSAQLALTFDCVNEISTTI